MSIAKERDLQSLSQVSINYIYFGFYFFFISLIHIYHVFLIEPTATFARFFFIAYALIQCAIETVLVVLFANAIKIFFRPKVMALYCIIVFFLLMTHVIDFPLIRFMDMSFWYALNFISGESPGNFIELLYASNISLKVWFVSGLFGAGILLSGIYLYRITERWTQRRPLVLHYPMLAATLCTLCVFLMSLDYSTHQWVERTHYDLYQKTLPWKNTVFHRQHEFLSLSHPLKKPPAQAALPGPLTIGKKPDLFLFVVESLREDYIQEDQAPHLSRFRNDNIHFDLALANANATQISWFSLFHSQFPLYFGVAKEGKAESIPLKLLKEMGYQINCYSSARLNYYEMDQLIFGKDKHLADQLFAFGNCYSDPAHVRDKKTIDKMIEDMTNSESGGRLFIAFLDSTHHDYSWPDEYSRFTPYEEKINFFKVAISNKGLEGIKNRYRNALHYIDALFGRFMQAFETYPGKEEAVIVVLGDHAEEFYEEGRLFHASSLSHAQTHIPLYYKFGKASPFKAKEHATMSCQMDIFPTLLHYLTGKEVLQDVVQGRSIFSEDRWPFTIMARFNASRNPCEFSLHNGKYKLTATFSDERDIFNAKGLRIISLKNDRNETISHDLHSIKEHFGDALDHIFIP